MTKNFILPVMIMVSGLTSGCLEQYKPFSFWKKLEEERVAAKMSGVTMDIDGNIKYLDDEGKLQVKASETVDPKLTETADQIYSNFCVTCHGANGEGVAAVGGRNFQDSVWQKETTDEQIYLAIKVGTAAIKTDYPDIYAQIQGRSNFVESRDFKGAMMPSGGRVPPLTEEQLQEMIKKIRTFAK